LKTKTVTLAVFFCCHGIQSLIAFFMDWGDGGDVEGLIFLFSLFASFVSFHKIFILAIFYLYFLHVEVKMISTLESKTSYRVS
jgi:hypothetical protein